MGFNFFRYLLPAILLATLLLPANPAFTAEADDALQKQIDKLNLEIQILDLELQNAEKPIIHLEKETATKFEALNQRMDDLLAYAGWTGGAISLLAIFIAIAASISFVSARRVVATAEKEIKNEIESAKIEIKKFLDELRESTETGKSLVNELLHIKQGEKLSPELEKEVNESSKEIYQKPETDRTFKDWYILGFKNYEKKTEKGYETALHAFDMASRLAGMNDSNLLNTLSMKSHIFVKLSRWDEGIVVIDNLLDRFSETTEPAMQKLVAQAHSNKGFYRIDFAKNNWVGDIGEDSIQLLNQSLEDSEKSLILRPDYPMTLGNKGYALFLLGREDEAEEIMRKALDLDAEKTRNDAIDDADIEPTTPRDEDFKALINRLWDERSED